MWLLWLYPPEFRARYEDEMLAVLEQDEVTLRTHLDLVRGAGSAWLQRRRLIMTSIPGAMARGAKYGLIPSGFLVAQYLLGLIRHMDSTVLNMVGLCTILSLLPACLLASALELRRGAGWGGCLLTGGTAGAVAVLAQTVVTIVIGVLTAAGFETFVYQLQGGGLVSSSTTVLGVLTDLRIYASAVVGALVTAIAGLGTAAVAVGGRGFWRRFRPA